MVLVQFIIFFKSSWGKIAIAWHAKKLIYTAPQAAATTFAFSSVFILYTSIYAPTTWGKTKLIIVPAQCHKENKCLLLLPIFYFLSLWTICFLFISFLTAFFSNIYILDIYIILYISMNKHSLCKVSIEVSRILLMSSGRQCKIHKNSSIKECILYNSPTILYSGKKQKF